MTRFDPSRFAVPGLALLSLLLLFGVAMGIFEQYRSYHVTIAAGARTGEAYVLTQALKTVAEAHYPKLKITVRETGGTAENLDLLERKEVQFAAAQADVPAGPSVRVVALLYLDAFQLLAHKDAKITWFPDLAGKRIALPRRGGQYQSFLRVAEHFGLGPGDFQFVEKELTPADFSAGKADAIFRVRALGNPDVTQLARNTQMRFVGIQQAAAMKIKIPSIEAALIPEGTYRGNPPVPEKDLPTVAVQRMLVAGASVPTDPVNWITAVLIERREELAHAIPDDFAEVRPLLAAVHAPATDPGMGAGVHPGALQFYDKDKPSFVQKYADFVALILSVVVLAGSWLWELKRYMERRQKNEADRFTKEVVTLMNQAQSAEEKDQLEHIYRRLFELLNEAVHALDIDRISEESFQSFRAVLVIALDVLRERRGRLEAA